MPRRSYFSGLPPLQRSVVLLGVLVSTSIAYVACGGSDRTFGSNQEPTGTGGDNTDTGGRSNGGSGNTGGRSNGGTSGRGNGGNGGGGGATGASGTEGGVGGATGVGGNGQGGSKDASAEDGPSSNAD
jgi:hypothetical protein